MISFIVLHIPHFIHIRERFIYTYSPWLIDNLKRSDNLYALGSFEIEIYHYIFFSILYITIPTN